MRTLLESLAYRVLGPVTKKKWLSGPVVPFPRYVAVYEAAFEMGIAIGYAYRDSLVWLAQLFADEGREQELVGALRGVVEQHLLEFPNATRMFDLGMSAEEARVRGEIRGRFPTIDLFSTNMTDDEIWEMPKKMAKIESAVDREANKLEIPVAVAFRNLQTVMSLGIGLGGFFGDRAERFWSNQYEQLENDGRLVRLRAAGLDLPAARPESLSLAQYGEQMRSIVNEFISKNRPELVQQVDRVN